MLAVYAVVDGNHAGWTSVQTTTLLGAALLLLALFLCIEARVRDPLMPLRLFRLRNVATANIVSVLWAAGVFTWFVIAALYMQHVLGYDPLQVGLAFVPADLVMAVFSAGLSARVVVRFGIRGPVWIGLLLGAQSGSRSSRAPRSPARSSWTCCPGMVLLGLGSGMAFNPVLLAAMGDVESDESGLASGVVNTSFMMGGALGLAVIASLADARTRGARAQRRGGAHRAERRVSARVRPGRRAHCRCGAGRRGAAPPPSGGGSRVDGGRGGIAADCPAQRRVSERFRTFQAL